MTTETMTVHRALAEMKVLEHRIIKLIDEAQFCAAAKKSMKKLNGVDIEEFKKDSKSKLDEINDLTARYFAMKCAVSDSNAKTHVSVAGNDYSVAVAIFMNQHGIDLKTSLLVAMDRQYANAIANIENANARLSDRADNFVSATNSTSDKNNMDVDTLNSMRQDYIDRETMVLIDGVDIKKAKDELVSKIDQFKAEVDAALSTSNAVTEITITY